MVPVVPDDDRPDETGRSVDVYDRRLDGTDFVLSSVHQDKTFPRWMVLVLAVAGVVIVLNLLPRLGAVDAPPPPTMPIAAATAPALVASPQPSPSPTPWRIHQTVDWPGGQLEVDIPARFSWKTDQPLALSTGVPPDTGLTVSFHSDVTELRTDLCRRGTFANVGPSADDLVAALTEQVGGRREGPVKVLVGGFPAWRFLLTVPPCADAAEGVTTWLNRDGSAFIPLQNGEVVIWVVDVGGDRMVITSDGRGTPSEDIVNRDAMIDSLQINPEDQLFPRFDPSGRLHGEIDGVGLTIGDQARDWERHRAYLSKSTKGPQGAEAMILWTTDPGGRRTVSCRGLLGHVGTSVDELAEAVARAPGTDLIRAPTTWWLDRRRATYLVVGVRELVDEACQPGFLFSWDDEPVGAFWPGVEPGDTIRVWIAQVDGARLVIEAATKPAAGPAIDRRIEEIVGSIRFDRPPQNPREGNIVLTSPAVARAGWSRRGG